MATVTYEQPYRKNTALLLCSQAVTALLNVINLLALNKQIVILNNNEQKIHNMLTISAEHALDII